MKKMIFLAVMAIGMMGLTASAQSALKIGYADVEYILSQMPEAQNVQAELQTYSTQLQKQYESKIQQYQQKVQEYQQNEATMVDAIKADKQREIIQMEQNIQQFQTDMQESMMQKQETLMSPLYEKVGTAIENVAKEGGYSHILSARVSGIDVLLYGDEQYDVSDIILRKMGITPQASN